MKALRSEKTERCKSPQDKKQNEYDKDVRPLLENPHAFRQNWPKKKARINRRRRKHIQKAIQLALVKGELDNASPELLKTVHPIKQVKKHFIYSLRQDIQAKLENMKK